MKDQVLALLKRSEDYLSGEAISRLLGVSRTAVWKQVNNLRDEGYRIDSQRNSGYRLTSVPDKLYPGEIQPSLHTAVLGREILHFETLDSTNRLARQEADKGCQEGTVVVAEEQTAGRGRLGRQWYSPKQSGIWMSVVLRPRIVPAEAPKITLVAAVAVAAALRDAGFSPRIKWPNDLLLAGKKVCGIYTEMKADPDQVLYLVLGIGINVSEQSFPAELADTATSLRLASGTETISRPAMAALVLDRLEEFYRLFLEQGFAGIRAEWKAYSLNLGRDVLVRTLQTVISGRAVDIDDQGMLLVAGDDGVLHRIAAGDVTLRPE